MGSGLEGAADLAVVAPGAPRGGLVNPLGGPPGHRGGFAMSSLGAGLRGMGRGRAMPGIPGMHRGPSAPTEGVSFASLRGMEHHSVLDQRIQQQLELLDEGGRLGERREGAGQASARLVRLPRSSPF